MAGIDAGRRESVAAGAGGGYAKAVAGPSTASRVYLSFVGMALALAGTIFCGLMWRSFQRARAVEKWPVVPCLILRSDVEERTQFGPRELRFDLLFAYDWQGKPYESKLVKLRGSGWSSSSEIADAYVKRYPEGSSQQCHVNPAKPEQAVLETESKAPGYSLWFPAIFVVGGFGMVVGAWRRPASLASLRAPVMPRGKNSQSLHAGRSGNLAVAGRAVDDGSACDE